MTLEELETLLIIHEDCKKQGYRTSDDYAAVLVMCRYNPPLGYKIRTPFGLCEIINCQQKDGKFQIVFGVSKRQLVKMINKIKEEGK